MENCSCRPGNTARHPCTQLVGELQIGPYGVPLINGVPIVGNISLPQLGLRGIYYDKTENWNAQTDLITQQGAVYIYSDYETQEKDDGTIVKIPNIKIGDGTTPLVDAPFISTFRAETIIDSLVDVVLERITDDIVEETTARLNAENRLVSDEDREKWDNKVRCRIDPENDGNLILSTD